MLEWKVGHVRNLQEWNLCRLSVNLLTGLVFCRREDEEFGIDAQERYGNDGSLL